MVRISRESQRQSPPVAGTDQSRSFLWRNSVRRVTALGTAGVAASLLSSACGSGTLIPLNSICTPPEKPYSLKHNASHAYVDTSYRDGVIVSFRVDPHYSDPNFPGSSLLVNETYTAETPRFIRVASIQRRPKSEAGGLIDVTKPYPGLQKSHPVTGIKPGDIYNVFLGVGNKADATMDARKYTVDVGSDSKLSVVFNGCAPSKPSLPSYRGGTPQP